MTTTTISDPDNMRWEARTQQYGNRVDEEAAIRAVDAAVFDKVTVLEQHLVSEATALQERGDVHLSAADEIETALRREVRLTLGERAESSRHADNNDIADRYTQLRAMSQQAINELERADREAEFLLASLDDPYNAYRSIVGKFGNLLAGRGI